MSLVSVIVPTFDRAATLGAAIDSVLAQTHPEVEVVVVDDGSTDGSAEVLAGYGDRIVVRRTANRGPAAARNEGMRAARGEYLAFLDSDDLYVEDKLAMQAAVLDAHPDLAMVSTDFSAFDDDGLWDERHLATYHRSAFRDGHGLEAVYPERRPLSAETVPGWRWPATDLRVGRIFETYVERLVVFTNSVMMRRASLAEVGGQDESLRLFEEYDFMLRVSRLGPAGFLDLPTYRLRYHPRQVSTTAGPRGGATAIAKQRNLLEIHRRYVSLDDDDGGERAAAARRHRARLHRALAVQILSNGRDMEEARAHLRECRRLGLPQPYLMATSRLPDLGRRIAFRVLALSERARR